MSKIYTSAYSVWPGLDIVHGRSNWCPKNFVWSNCPKSESFECPAQEKLCKILAIRRKLLKNLCKTNFTLKNLCTGIPIILLSGPFFSCNFRNGNDFIITFKLNAIRIVTLPSIVPTARNLPSSDILKADKVPSILTLLSASY